MIELGIKSLLSYALGTLLGSLLLGKLRGVDIRRLGSGNAGATNALRTQGKLFGLAVLLIDIGKGVLAVRWLPSASLPGVALDVTVARAWLSVACACAVILGHVYPVWYGFRGGKGVATIVGVVAALKPLLLLPLVVTWLAVLLLTGYVGLSSMLAGVVMLGTVAWLNPENLPLLSFCAVTVLFVMYTHRGNIARMRAGTEHRARLWLFPPRRA